MADALRVVGDGDFDRTVLRSAVPVLVDFTAAWCAPCRALAPALAALARDHVGRLEVVALDVDRSPVTAERYGVRSMPTLIFFRDGRPVRQLLGAVPRRLLEAAAGEVLSGAPAAPAALG